MVPNPSDSTRRTVSGRTSTDPDGVSGLVNGHKLDHKPLESLTYADLADGITAQAAAAKHDVTGADLRLKAAQDLQEKLKLIRTGEPPYDLFVRRKPIDQQPIGGNPELNDGVRLSIRPFVTAGILRKTPARIKRTRDRGNEPRRPGDPFPWCGNGDTFKGKRVKDVPLTNAEKQAARNARVGWCHDRLGDPPGLPQDGENAPQMGCADEESRSSAA